MMCRQCGGRFERSELSVTHDLHPYGDGVVEEMMQVVCPDCGADELYEEHGCAQCGEEWSSSELEDGLCRLCIEELLETLDWAWTMLSPAQKRWAAEHTAWMEN